MVGYKGWKTVETLRAKFQDLKYTDGLICLDPLQAVINRPLFGPGTTFSALDPHRGAAVYIGLLDAFARDLSVMSRGIPVGWNYDLKRS